MQDPSVAVAEIERLAELRIRAAARLGGPVAQKGPAARAADALSVLHALASSPDTAAHALALLHELQVHQVELDLQAQELRESRTELESVLRRQIELYDYQPVGCFTLDARLVLHELNQTGADMLGVARDDAYGLPLDAFLSPASAARFKAAVAAVGAVGAGVRPAGCAVELVSKEEPGRPVIASIGIDPAADRYLVSLTPAAA